MIILGGKSGTGKTYSFKGSNILHVSNTQELESALSSPGPVLINVWDGMDYDVLHRYRNNDKIYIELHLELDYNDFMKTVDKRFKYNIRYFYYPSLDEKVAFGLPEDVANKLLTWYDVVNYKKYGIVPFRNSSILLNDFEGVKKYGFGWNIVKNFLG
ncbi:MAG: hypothetical protein QXV17_10680 [Candidatus Micrarchaeaceae archaeon]